MTRSRLPDKPIVTHRANPRGRDFVVGDVHGHFDTPEHARDALAFDPERDRLFSVGDLIDRGPRSADALEWLRSGRILAVRGNHEQMMIDALERGRLRLTGYTALWYDNGGEWFGGDPDFDDDDDEPIVRGVNYQPHLQDWLDAMANVPSLRRVETTAGAVGIVHTLPDGHADWRARDEAVTEGARRAAQTQYPGVAFVPTDIAVAPGRNRTLAARRVRPPAGNHRNRPRHRGTQPGGTPALDPPPRGLYRHRSARRRVRPPHDRPD